MCEKLRSRCSRAGVKVNTLRAAYELGASHVHDLLRNHNVPWDTEADVSAAADAVEVANGSPSPGGVGDAVPPQSAHPPLAANPLGITGTSGSFNVNVGTGGVRPQHMQDGAHLHSVAGLALASAPVPQSTCGHSSEALPLLDIKAEFKADFARMNGMHDALDGALHPVIEALPGIDIEPMHADAIALSAHVHMHMHSPLHMHDSFAVGMGGAARGAPLQTGGVLGGVSGMVSTSVCVTCGEVVHACQVGGQECGGCANLRERGVTLGLDHTTITTRVRIAGRSAFELEIAQSEAQQHAQHAQQHARQWSQHLEAASTVQRSTSGRVVSSELDAVMGVAMGAPSQMGTRAQRKPQRGRVCLVCQEMKGLSDFRVVAASALPKEICGECVRVCDAVAGVGIAWPEVRQAMADGTVHGLLEAAGCM